jgi:serine/threonine-protein kinase
VTTEGRLLAGRYELGEVLGYGGMAEVFRGVDVRLGREVAVKILRADLARDPSFLGRFRREAQAAASLNHPAIVSVYDTGEDDGTPYIVMEYVAGRTLRDALRTEGRLLPRRALEIVAAVCDALEYSHRAGIVHRDIKPGNVMLTPTGDVKVMDFGIARALAGGANTATQTATVLGTAQYLSPEQARGEVVDARSDVYSAGCLLYELLTGSPPFTGENAVAVAYQHVREEAALPSSVNPDLTPDLDAVVMKALAKNPANRYQSAEEFRLDLERAAAGRRVAATPLLANEAPTQVVVPAAATQAMTPYTPPPPRYRRGAVYGALLVLVIALIVVGALLAKHVIGSAKQTVHMPNVVGDTQAAAEATLKRDGFVIGPPVRVYEGTDNNSSPAGIVFLTEPIPKASVTKGATVTLYVSRGSGIVTVPSLTGLDLAQAAALLRKDGLTLGPAVAVDKPGRAAGLIFAQNPKALSTTKAGTAVDVTYASGDVQLGYLVGETVANAEYTLTNVDHLTYKIVQVPVTDAAENGYVLSQNPSAGSVPAGTTVTLRVGQYTKPTTSPSASASASPSTSASP